MCLHIKITSQRQSSAGPLSWHEDKYYGIRFFARSHPIIGRCVARAHINTMVTLPEQQHKKTERQQDVVCVFELPRLRPAIDCHSRHTG